MWVFISKWSKHQHLHWIGYCSNISNMIIAFLNLKHTSCYDHLLSSECVSTVVFHSDIDYHQYVEKAQDIIINGRLNNLLEIERWQLKPGYI